MAYINERDLVKKEVVSADGRRLGTVAELALHLQGKLGFVVENKDGDRQTIPITAVQGVADFVVLKPGHDAAADGADATKQPPRTAPAPKAAVASTWTPASTPAAPATTSAPAASAPCKKCGKTTKPGARFCGSCGNPVG